MANHRPRLHNHRMGGLGDLIRQAPVMACLREQIRRIIERTSSSRRLPPILLQGETGTGKNLVARVIHRAGPRGDGPFIDVNCAAIPAGLLEAELFGFERGAFTDARQPKAGLFESAHGGTILLDEVALLSDALQAKLLNIIEERRVRRLGSTRSDPVDISIIAATNEDLLAAVHAGRFREDLYHRLAVLTLRLPSLRERREDIPILAEHFLARACQDYGLPSRRLTSSARAALCAHGWPGNVRELANMMERVALLAETPHIDSETLDLLTEAAGSPTAPPTPVLALDAQVESLERQQLLEALEETRWNVVRAADRLGITRAMIRHRILKYDLIPPSRRARRRQSPAAPPPPRVAHPVALPPATPRWESRLVVLLMAILHSTDAADLGRDFDTVVQKLESFGGRFEEAAVSRVVAAFGVDPAEDATRRAALAAMAIRNALAANVPSPARRTKVAIAVHAEKCPVANVGGRAEMDGDARHRMMTVLNDLCARAEPEAVLVSKAARSLLSPQFDFDEPDACPQSIEACRLRGYSQHRFGFGAHAGRFVRREHELGVLLARWQEARAGRGQIVALVGEPGIGKSRLLFEFRQALRDESLLYLEGRAESYGVGIPYLPVIGLLRGFFHIEERDDPTVRGEKVRAQLVALDQALVLAVSPLLALIDASGTDPEWQTLDPPQRRQRTLDALSRFVLRLSQTQAVLLAIEDLHWIDAQTQAFLDRLVVSLQAARVLVLVSYRPEHRPSVSSQTSYTQLHLDPLAPPSAEELQRGLVGDDVALRPLTRLLLERTEGNPFFLEESVRMLVESGELVGERGAYRPARDLRALQVPPTVGAVLAARVNRLAREDKHLIQAAAVIGRDVPFGLLEAIADVPEATLRASLTKLQMAEFLRETRLFPEVEYTFKHALTHDVAYGTLAADRQRVLHARLVEALERAYPERLVEVVERLAHHALAAELWPKALAYGRQAGAKAAWRSAHREAVEYFRHALGAIRRLPESRAMLEETLSLRHQLRWSLVPLGEYAELSVSLRDANALAERLGDQLQIGELSASMTNYFRQLGDCDEAVRAGSRARVIAVALGNRALEVGATYQLGLVYRQLGDHARAISELRTLVETLVGESIHERFGSPAVYSVHARTWMAMSLADVGQFAEGLALAEEAVQIAADAKNAFSELNACLCLGTVHLQQESLDRAIPILERSLTLCRDGNFDLLLPGTASALGAALTLAGRVDEALPLLELAVETAMAKGLKAGASLHLVRLGRAMLLARRSQNACEIAHRALDAARTHKERGNEAWALHLLTEVAAHGDSPDSEAAARYGAEGMALAHSLGMLPLVAQCRSMLDRL
jgi:DNA-binding NtrC family response regulator/tetratricopeptide (TPR) repeat protein